MVGRICITSLGLKELNKWQDQPKLVGHGDNEVDWLDTPFEISSDHTETPTILQSRILNTFSRKTVSVNETLQILVTKLAFVLGLSIRRKTQRRRNKCTVHIYIYAYRYK